MRILFLSHYALPHIGGTESAIDGLSRELRRRGHEVRHVTSTAGAGGQAPGGAAVVRVAALNALEERLEVPYPLFSPRLFSVLRREVPAADVVHAHGLLYMPSVLGLGYARVRHPDGPVRVVTEHVGHVPYESQILDRAEWLALRTLGALTGRAAEGVIVLNDRVAEEVRGLGRPVVTIANGIDLDSYRPPRNGEREALRDELGWDERPRVLFAGRLVGKKGLDLALEAAAAAEGRFRLVVVGPGTLNGGGASVEVLGALPRERLAMLYRAADALLLPSAGEGFPVTAQEAMASGLPAVMRDTPEVESYVAGAEGGVRLVPPDPGAVVAAVEEVVAQRAELGAAARRHAERIFSWEKAADAHERLYATVRDSRG